jgi:hypothetical protein
LKDNGILFLKCFSDKEPRQEGPYKFSQGEIRSLFSKYFIIDSIKETGLSRNSKSIPKGIICSDDKEIVTYNNKTHKTFHGLLPPNS